MQNGDNYVMADDSDVPVQYFGILKRASCLSLFLVGTFLNFTNMSSVFTTVTTNDRMKETLILNCFLPVTFYDRYYQIIENLRKRHESEFSIRFLLYTVVNK
jgi:hypothetical protein